MYRLAALEWALRSIYGTQPWYHTSTCRLRGGSGIRVRVSCTKLRLCWDLLSSVRMTWNESFVRTLALGENNCHGVMGNAAQKSGYGCEMVAMVDLWRRAWSKEPDTTDPVAPFGIVTLASGGSEGNSNTRHCVPNS